MHFAIFAVSPAQQNFGKPGIVEEPGTVAHTLKGVKMQGVAIECPCSGQGVFIE